MSPAPFFGDDRTAREAHHSSVIADPSPAPLDQDRAEDQSPNAERARACDLLRELQRQRQDLHRAEKSLTLQIKAKCRRLCAGDKTQAAVLYDAMFGKDEHDLAAAALLVSKPFIDARAFLIPQRKETEKQMTSQARALPVAAWIETIPGVGLLGLAMIVGECGDLANYSTVAKLWKRLGLATVNGERQRRVKGAAAKEHGYSPQRRSVMWTVGQALFKAQSGRVDADTGEEIKPAGPYRLVYDEYKAKQLPRCEALAPTMRAVGDDDERKYSAKAHAHNRATRYMEKRFVAHLWSAWRQAS